MNNKSGFSLDFKEFNTKFNNLTKNVIPSAAEKGLFNAAWEMLRDADKEIPMTPFRHGALRGSKTVENPKVTGNEISVTVGYNMKYAAKLHEMPKTQADRTNWSLPGSGNKFLESKMVRNKEKYMKIVAKTIETVKV